MHWRLTTRNSGRRWACTPTTRTCASPTWPSWCDGRAAPVVAIGETGLDYYRLNGRSVADMEWQRERFRTHIRAASRPASRWSSTPAAQPTRCACWTRRAASGRRRLPLLHREGRSGAAAVERGFYISFSGILTFKNAQTCATWLKLLPLDRLLIETDSPYLAPVPFRGKTNSPAYVPHVAKAVAEAVGLPVAELAAQTTANTRRLFGLPEMA
jgi:TatD DNase family protein